MDRLLAATPVVILAGGLGTRLRPALADRPKGLAPIGGDPFLEIQISLLRRQGARRFGLCVGHQAGQIQAALGDGGRLGVQIEYSIETGALLGTAGALKLAERFFNPRALVLNGDTYFDIDYAGLLAAHRPEALATLALAPIADRSRYGTVEFEPATRRITRFAEKAAEGEAGPGWVSAGAYVVERRLLDLVTPGRPCSIEREVFPRALTEHGALLAHPCQAVFYDIGTPESWQAFEAHYQGEAPAGSGR